jgi:hypothetical protein
VSARRPPRARVWLLALALACLLVDQGSVPHLHDDDEPGVYNAEHDLVTLNAFATAVAVPDGAPAVVIAAAAAPLGLPAAPAPRAHVRRHADFRAPPSA